MLFLSSLDNLLFKNVIFQEGVDNFEIEQKSCYFLGRRCSTPLSKLIVEFAHEKLLLFLVLGVSPSCKIAQSN